MTRFRQFLRTHRLAMLVVTLVTGFQGAEGALWADVARAEHARAERLEQMAERLGVAPERLERRQEGLVEAIDNLLSSPEEELRSEGLARLEARMGAIEAEVVSNPFRDRAEEVKAEYAPARAEAFLRVLAEIGAGRLEGMSRAGWRAYLETVRSELKAAAELPERADLPPAARAQTQARAERMRGRIESLVAKLRPILNAPEAVSDARLERTLERVAAAVAGEVAEPQREPRFAERPLPMQRVEREAETAEAATADRSTVQPSAALVASAAAPAIAGRSGTVAPEIAALAAELETPARIFAWVHDSIQYDPKWGAVRSPLGTLLERRGTSWDQAWLLRELLAAAGVEAVLEWGDVKVPAALLTEQTGVSDPFRAGDLLATAGVPSVLLVDGSRVVSARMSHVWVKAHVDYVPNRGATSGTPDSWIRMDPSLKRHGYTEGLTVHEQVPYALETYLESATRLSPRRAYEDALWAYIRANDVSCETLEQLKRRPQIVEEAFSILPGALMGEILSLSGQAAVPPDAFRHRVRIEVVEESGGSLLTHELAWTDAWGEPVEIGWRGATADDQEVLDLHGGVFETPPYLVELAPEVRLAGAPVASGSAIGSAEAVEVRVTLLEAGGFESVRTHDTLSGERHFLAVDFGALPQAIVDRHRDARGAAAAAGDSAELEASELHLLGAQYLHDLATDLEDLAAWKHHRLVGLGVQALISQNGAVSAKLNGAPVAFSRAERTVDVAAINLGLFHADADRSFRAETFELLGSQSSYLEGEIFDHVLERQGIAAVSALTESKRRGQALTPVDSGNVSNVLAAVDLDPAVEAEVSSAVSRGWTAWVAEDEITVNRWTGTGYVLLDPQTGSFGYLISGSLGGGSDTGESLESLQDALGNESWLSDGPVGGLLLDLLAAAGGGGEGPSTQQADPVNMSTGNYWHTEADMSVLARGLPITWYRTYNSRSGYEGPLGYGWTFSYGERLEERSDGSIVYREDDGTEHLFAPDGAGGFMRPWGKHLELTKGADGYRLRTKEGSSSRFAPDGHLVSLSDANGNTVTLGYDAAGDLATVRDAAGRTVLTVTTDSSGRIIAVQDLSGRTVRYGYAGSDLTSVTDEVGEVWTYAYDARHNLVGRTNPLGQTDTMAYDVHDRCYKHIDPTGAEETFSYTSRGSRAVLTDPRGYDTYLELDQRGRAVLEVDPLGNAMRSTWDDDNNRTSTTDPRGGLTVRRFDQDGNLLAETDPLGNTTSWTYDPRYHKVLTVTDPTGHTVANDYDSAGNLTEISETVDGVRLTQTFGYDPHGQLMTVTDARGHTQTRVWDPTKGTLESQTDAEGNTTLLSTDALGRITGITDPGGNTSSVEWDGKDRLTRATDPFGNETTLTYDPAGRRLAISTPIATRTTTYDAAGRPIVSTDPLGNTVRTEYDAAGNAVLAIDAEGNRTSTTYDPVGRVAATVDPPGAVWTLGYCGEIGSGGNGCAGGGCSGSDSGRSFCELTDPLGNTTHQEFDELGRVISVTDPEGHTRSVAYDSRGQKTAEIDALGRSRGFEYDALGRLTAVQEANGARTEYTYDSADNLLEILDAEGRSWRRTYDARGNLVSETDPESNTTGYAYDALGNLSVTTRPDGSEVRYEYEVRRRTAVVLPDGTGETFSYDQFGRRVAMSNPEVSLSFSYDAANRIIGKTNVTLGQSVRYSYGPRGNRTSATGPLGSTEYLYDAAGRLVVQTDPVSGTYRLGYDPAGRRTSLAYPNGVVTEYQYDASSRLEVLVTRDPRGILVDGYRYAYDPVGNRTSMRSIHDDLLHEYLYDEVDRLTRWQRGSDRFEEFTYDDVGNRLTLQDERGTVTYRYDRANRLLERVRALAAGGSVQTDYTWAPNGNLLRETESTGEVTTYTWDALERLTALDGPAGSFSYGYDPEGVRVRQSSGDGTDRYLHAGEDVVATYRDGVLDTWFTHGPGIDEPWAEARPADEEGAPRFLHADGLGSITAVSDRQAGLRSTTSYGAFGEIEESTGLQGRYGYTGRERDASGLLHYRARYYQPEVGRFASADSFAGDPRRPASLHRFTYVENNPINRVDPSGHVALKAAGLVFLGSGLWQIYSFFSWGAPELQALTERFANRDSDLEFASRVALFYSLEMIVLVVGYLYTLIGWELLLFGKASFRNFRFAKAASDTMDLVRNLRAFAFPNQQFWVLVILTSCIKLLGPLFLSRSLSSARDRGIYAATGGFCVAGTVGVLKARGII